MMEFNHAYPEDSLRLLVHEFDKNPQELNAIPKSFADYFGYPILARTLNIKYPKIPKFDQAPIVNLFKYKTYSSIDNLTSDIKQFSTEIEQLFAIFYWIDHNIAYDVERSRQIYRELQTIENVFETKKAVCEGYVTLFLGLAQKVGIHEIKLQRFENVSKGDGHNLYEPPDHECEVNHVAVYVEINGIQYLCGPTWGAGYIDAATGKYEFQFVFQKFLIPLPAALVYYYPGPEEKKLIPFEYSFKQFTNTGFFPREEFELATESHPFSHIKSSTGTIRMQFSSLEFDHISGKIFLLMGDTWYEQDRELINIKIVQTGLPNRYFSSNLHADAKRCRFILQAAFPQTGSWKIEFFINANLAYTTFVEVTNSSDRIPFLRYEPRDTLLIPVTPKQELLSVSSLALIRFAVAPKRSNIQLYLFKVIPNTLDFSLKYTYEESLQYYRYSKLLLPFDQTRYEDWISLTFPENGRYCAWIFLQNDDTSYTEIIKYFFDVSNAKNNYLPPVTFMKSGREFVPLILESPLLKMDPAGSTVIVNSLETTITITFQCDPSLIYFNLKDAQREENTIFLKLIDQKQNGDIYEQKYQMTFPKGGSYDLLCFVGDDEVFSQQYELFHTLSPPDKYENELLDTLEREITNTYDELADIPEALKSRVFSH